MIRRAPALLLVGFLLCDCGSDSPLPHSSLVRACIARNSCSVRPYPRVADCVTDYYDQQVYYGLRALYAKIYACVAAANGDCERIFQCFGMQRASPRCDKSFAASCDGARALSCDLLTGQSYSEDCSASGLGCVVPAGGSFAARCSPGGCDSSFQPRCDGTKAQSCNQGLVEVVDCAARGEVCGGAAQCTGNASESCDSTGRPRCEGQVAVSCVGGRLKRQDCSALAYRQRCQEGACVEAGTQCSGDLDRCAGAELEACLEGSWQRFDCAAAGFLPCQPSKTGAACGARN